jgi:hypothetical protein
MQQIPVVQVPLEDIKKIKDELARIEKDERLSYPTATVFENAPLALAQCGLENQAKVLKWVLKILEVQITEKIDTSFINTSVEDLQSSLYFAEANGSRIFNSAVLQKAFAAATRRGEKTKARLIQRYIKKAIKKESAA